MPSLGAPWDLKPARGRCRSFPLPSRCTKGGAMKALPLSPARPEYGVATRSSKPTGESPHV